MSEEHSKLTLILFSGDFDKSMAALTMANAAAGNGMEVKIFFTFWGLNLLRRQKRHSQNTLQNLFKWMMPVGPSHLGLSKMNFLGIGPWLMKKLIRQKSGQTVADLFKMARDRHVHFIACEASLKLLGIEPDELIEYQHLEIASVDTFLENAVQSKVAMFI